jgi:hypothetical protein
MESIELVRELNEFAHTLLELEIDRCVPERFFSTLPGSGVVSAAGIYAHAVLGEDHFVSGRLGEPLTYVLGEWEPRLGFEPRADITEAWAEGLRFEVDLMRDYARAVSARSDAFFAGLSANGSQQAVSNWRVIREDGQVRYEQRKVPLLFGFMDNVTLHNVGHAGEIAVVTNLARGS